MKRTSFLVILLTFAIKIYALSLDIHVTEAGNLMNQVNLAELGQVRQLTLHGEINGTDIIVIRKMSALQDLDMSDTKIVGGGNSYDGGCYTIENVMGDFFPYLTNPELCNISLPRSITKIGAGAFESCIHIRSVDIPESVTSIEALAFKQCQSLESLIIPETVKEIGFAAFEGCGNLKFIRLPQSLIRIEPETFYGCNNLGLMELPEKINYIGENAFSYCSNMKSITLPLDISYIGEGAFEECNSMMSIILSEPITCINSRTFKNCRSLSTIKIPDGVTDIDDEAFYGCTGLKSIVLGKSVESIGSRAFTGFYIYGDSAVVTDRFNLKEFISCNPIPPNGSGIFDNICYSTTTLKVPKGCFSNYFLDPDWGKFTNIVEVDLTGVSSVDVNNENPFLIACNAIVLTTSNESVEIYTVDGKKIYKGIAIQGARIPLPSSGMYVVKIGSYTTKIIL